MAGKIVDGGVAELENLVGVDGDEDVEIIDRNDPEGSEETVEEDTDGDGAKAGKDKGAGADTSVLEERIGTMGKTIERLERDLEEARRRPAAAEDTDDEPEDEEFGLPKPEAIENDKFLDELAANPRAALAKVLGIGHVRDLLKLLNPVIESRSARTARGIVQNNNRGLATDAELARDFADLKDPKSDLFKRTKEILADEARLDPTLAKSPRALLLAAKLAKSQIDAENGNRNSDRNRESDRDRDRDRDNRGRFRERNDDRDARIRAQGIRSTRRETSNFEDDEEFSSDALSVMKAMRVAPEQYRKYSGTKNRGRR